MHLVSLMTRQAALPALARACDGPGLISGVRAHSWAVVCDVYYLDPMVGPGEAVRVMTALASRRRQSPTSQPSR
jgi:hypothetical protein